MITRIVLAGVVAIWLHQLMDGLDGLWLFSGLRLHRINGLLRAGSVKLINTEHALLGPVCPVDGSLKDHNPGGSWHVVGAPDDLLTIFTCRKM